MAIEKRIKIIDDAPKASELKVLDIGNDYVVTKIEKASLRRKRGLVIFGKRYQYDRETGENLIEPMEFRAVIPDSMLKKIKEMI